MPAAIVHLTGAGERGRRIEQGADYDITFRVKNVDLETGVVRWAVKRRLSDENEDALLLLVSGVDSEMTLTEGTGEHAGKWIVRVILPWSLTKELPATNGSILWKHQLEASPSDMSSIRLVEGDVEVSREAFR